MATMTMLDEPVRELPIFEDRPTRSRRPRWLLAVAGVLLLGAGTYLVIRE